MRQLINAMNEAAQRALDRKATSTPGIVTSYNPNTYSVKVTLQPDGTETGWLPLLSQQVGNGFGIYCPPNPGDLVHVVFTDGEVEAGVAVGAYYNNEDKPLPVPAGEIWLVHKSGGFVKLTTDGKLLVQDQSGSTVTMNADGTGTMSFASGLTINADTQVNGNLRVAGDVSDLNTAHGTLADLRNTYDSHDHAVPNAKAGSDTLTTATPGETL
jgi:phage baseplate assembly protein V